MTGQALANKNRKIK